MMDHRRRTFGIAFLTSIVVTVSGWALAACMQPESGPGPGGSATGRIASTVAGEPEAVSSTETDKPLRWFFLLAAVNAHPRLESEKLIHKYWEPAMRLLAPGYDGVNTIGDLRDDFLLWPPHVEFGRVLSRRWALLFQVGYTAGKVRTKDNDPSIFLLPLHTDFEIGRSALFGGVGVDYFPFGMPELREYKGIMERLRAARPGFGPRFVLVRATYDVKMKMGFRPFPNLLSLELSDKWLVPSLNLNACTDIPLGKRSALSLNAGYSFFKERAYDFEGPLFTIAWKRYF